MISYKICSNHYVLNESMKRPYKSYLIPPIFTLRKLVWRSEVTQSRSQVLVAESGIQPRLLISIIPPKYEDNSNTRK